MSSLNQVITTQNVELEIDLIELAYDHIESVDNLKELLEGVSPHTVDLYKEELREKAKEELYDNINDTDNIVQFLSHIDTSIADEYRQKIIDEASNQQSTDLIDAICSANQDELQDVLICILNQKPKALHQFLASKQAMVQLAMIESAQALLKDLEHYF